MTRFITCLVLCVAACSGSHTPDDAGAPDADACSPTAPEQPRVLDGATAIEAVCPAVADKLCAQWQRCACPPASGTFDLAACRTRIASECDSFLRTPQVVADLASGTLRWSAGNADTFLASLDAATTGCDPVRVDLSRAALGGIGVGGACNDISGPFSECLEGSSCQGGISPSDPRSCQVDPVATAYQPPGAACAPTYDCAGGRPCLSSCSDLFGVCAAELAPLGADCATDRGCASGVCRIDPATTTGTCVGSHAGDHGDTCVTAADCMSGLACRRGRDPGICGTPIADGAPCTASASCASGFCRFTAPATDCPSDVWPGCFLVPSCRAERCSVSATAGVCDPGGAIGATCASGTDCRSGTCVAGLCTSPPPIVSGATCVAGALCLLGACYPDTCDVPACTASIDPTGHGTFWLRPPVFAP